MRVHLNNPDDLPIQRVVAISHSGLSYVEFHTVDANGADILTDFLTNALHGANFQAASLGQLSGFAASYYTYCAAAGPPTLLPVKR